MSIGKVIIGDARELDIDRFQKYGIIVSDPPWWYADQRKVRKDGKTPTKGIGACHHYGQMKTPEIERVQVQKITADRCMLFLWATCPLLPDAMSVMNAWGFKYSTIAFVWVKINPGIIRKSVMTLIEKLIHLKWQGFMDKLTVFGPGFYTGSNIELVLLGIKGKPFEHRFYKASQVVYAPRGKHSQKPEAVQDRIELMYSHAKPYLEMFARRSRHGWDVFGNDIEETNQLL